MVHRSSSAFHISIVQGSLDPDYGHFLSSIWKRPNPPRTDTSLIMKSNVVGALLSSADVVSHISDRLSSVFLSKFFTRLQERVTAARWWHFPLFRLLRKNDQITHFRSCPSTPVVSHRSLGLSSPFSPEFFRSGQRSPSRIPCPFTSLALAKAASRSTRSFSLVCFDSGSIAYFRRAVKGFRPFFCGGRKTRSTRRFHHRLPTPPAFQWSCPILKKTTKSQRVGFTPGNSDFWIVGFHQRWPP